MMPTPIITLLTDFGDTDGYVGAMKGVMLSIAPNAHLVDISHAVAPQNIHQAARIIQQTAPYYPSDTTHLIVVDPGVGSPRAAVAVESTIGRFVAPDNGVLTPVFDADPNFKAVELTNSGYWRAVDTSATFHGRDIFSPAAAHLAAGVALEELGERFEGLKRLSQAPYTREDDHITGRIVHIDHFGNAITSIAPVAWQGDSLHLPDSTHCTPTHVTCGGHTFRTFDANYSAALPGEVLVLIGSQSELEIAINQGSAAKKFDLHVGDTVTLYFD